MGYYPDSITTLGQCHECWHNVPLCWKIILDQRNFVRTVNVGPMYILQHMANTYITFGRPRVNFGHNCRCFIPSFPTLAERWSNVSFRSRRCQPIPTLVHRIHGIVAMVCFSKTDLPTTWLYISTDSIDWKRWLCDWRQDQCNKYFANELPIVNGYILPCQCKKILCAIGPILHRM